ncbi:MAG: hypothetical protein HQL48_05750 [Gammaproteobacteria bacterium]|nr:hypothetical protein [Gammaproteobacteria bacterium]
MDFATLFEDPVALMSTLSVVGAIVVIVYLSMKVVKLINTTNSDDQ